MTTLKIYDTAKKSKREFVPINPPQVKMYCCGPTVYDYLHIGNFRGAVFYNFLKNWLEFVGYKVTFIYNFTDIDDKILDRSKKENKPPHQLTQKYIEEFKKDFKSLQLKPHNQNPQATQTIPEIIALIEKLITLGQAYEINGDVFYSVNSFQNYGALSGRNTDDLLAGARVEINKNKREPLDFSLWKKAKPDENWSWDSPWGKGRPGWHIECTAMIHKFLGSEIDIHGGGTDLIFPHHENEIAQSEPISHNTYVRYWIHNNMIVTIKDKMSKSLGNIISMRDFLNQYPAEVFKYWILSAHYRSPIQYSKNTIHQALSSLARIYSCFVKAESILKEYGQNKKPYDKFDQILKNSDIQIIQAFNDDFGTPKAFAELFLIINAFSILSVNPQISRPEKAWCSHQMLLHFKKYGDILSLFQEPAQKFLKNLDDYLLKQKNLSRDLVDQIVQERHLARQKKDFKTADILRARLDELGIEVQDKAQKSLWEVKKHSV